MARISGTTAKIESAPGGNFPKRLGTPAEAIRVKEQTIGWRTRDTLARTWRRWSCCGRVGHAACSPLASTRRGLQIASSAQGLRPTSRLGTI